MRHQYTPIFRDLLNSSLWASASPSTRCVWITFLLDADPEGCIPTSIPGLALRANVSLEEARAAVAMLEAPDPDSRTADFEGRRIMKIDHGWQVLNFVAWRERAKVEAEKARKRRWANANAKRPPVANDNDEPDASSERLVLDASSETLDAPKPKPTPKSLSSEGEMISPTPLRGDFVETRSVVIDQLPDDWQPSEELRESARIAGVKNLDHWIAKLRLIRIGGKSGILAHKLDEWVEAQLPTWRTWEETERAKEAHSRAAAGAPGGFRGGGLPPMGPEPTERHRAFASKYGLDLVEAVRECVEHNYTTANYPAKELQLALERQLVSMKRAREATA